MLVRYLRLALPHRAFRSIEDEEQVGAVSMWVDLIAVALEDVGP
jgi:hypothetical protein